MKVDAWIVGGVFIVAFLLSLQMMSTSRASEKRTWRYVNELSQEELQKLDLRAETPRDTTFPYLPAEPYPYAAPYSAEEMGFIATDFAHMPRHNCALIEDYGTISANGYLTTAQAIGLVSYREPAGLLGQLQTKPGEWYTQWLFQTIAPAERHGRQSLYTLYRTDQTHQIRLDLFVYSPELRRVRRQPQPRRQDKALGTALGYENFLNRDAWEFRWRILGTDVLYETVRFPRTRASITLTAADGSLSEAAPNALKIMGRDYPAYTPEGGVACYVVEARTREEWIPGYYAPKILYWLDQQAFFPLRIEEYDPAGVLTYIEDRTAQFVNPELKNKGYEAHIFLSWDIPQDIMSYDVHDAYRPQAWTAADQEIFFSPDFLRRVWFVAPLKSQATVPSPETFFLRPALYRDKFPQDRKIEISSQLQARIRAQDAAGRLVFEENHSTR
ncbi:MAG: DUF1329 domain-containing protein [Deltaproteobacteria bacterium]|nr:DUF1329 domain-containing protein [Deltaproteobacteria bacterium]